MTNSLTAAPLGVQRPQILHLPPDVTNLDAATEAIELAESVGLMLDESQKFTIQCALGEASDGRWSAFEVADFEPRQNGKGDTIEARELFGLYVLREPLIIHTAHEFKTANEAFLRMVARIDACADLSRLVARFRWGSGEQAVELTNGSRLKYAARTGGSGRGFTKAGTVIYDEAQELEAEHIAASLPTMATHPNPQVWYAGSAGLGKSTMAWRLRKRALKGNAGRLAYLEHTAEQVELDDRDRVVSVRPDSRDRKMWALANPAFGYRISESYVASELDAMGDDKFCRERLGVWDPLIEDGVHVSVFENDVWTAARDPHSQLAGRFAFALDVAPDSRTASIATAGVRSDGKWHGEVIECAEGSEWVVARLVQAVQKAGAACAVIGVNNAGGLLPELRAVLAANSIDVEVVEITGKSYGQACEGLYAYVQAGEFRHLGQTWLDTAVAGARQREVGDVKVWDRKKWSVDITPLCAVTVALRAFQTAPEPENNSGGFVDLDDYLDD